MEEYSQIEDVYTNCNKRLNTDKRYRNVVCIWVGEDGWGRGAGGG